MLLAQPFYSYRNLLAGIADFSWPVISERYVISHPIQNSSASSSGLNAINIVQLDYSYFIAYLVSNGLVLLFCFIQIKACLRRNFGETGLCECLRVTLKLAYKSIKNGFHGFKTFHIPFFGVIVFCVYLLTFLTQIFIGNSFKTSKILIDTNEIIHDERQLFDSKRFICWIRSEPSLMLGEMGNRSFCALQLAICEAFQWFTN